MDNELTSAIKELKTSIDDLKESVDSLTTIQKDIFKDNPHDMMRELNGSMQELIKSLDSRPR